MWGILYVLLIPVPPCDVTCRCATHAAATVENDFLIRSRLLKAVRFSELFPVQVQRPGEARQWEIDRRRDHALQNLIRLPYINQIRILNGMGELH